MIYLKAFLGFLKASALARWIFVSFIGFGGLWIYGAMKHHQGFVAGKETCERAVADALSAETERQILINEKAQDEARRIAEDFLKEKARLEQIIMENANASANDPNRDLCGIGADGVQRLNKIRR